MFLFGGCAEQVLENSTSDTVPSTTSGEETFSGVKAQFSSSTGRVPQPSDLILNSLNSALVAAGGSALTGVNRQMPIRVPFSGSLASLYSDNGSWNSTNGLKLAQNLLIFPSDNASAVVTPWPKFDKANNSVTGGKFKAVQQDSNYDLVLVPDSDTFVDNKTYQSFDIETINKSLNINFIAPMLIYRNSINYMKLRKFGRIINCSSIGTKFGGGENTFSYSLAKHCSEFIPSEIRRLARYNVLFNNIKLGVVKTKLHKNIKNKNITNRIKKIPARRSAKLDEIINLIKFFIRDNSYIASETVNISGGE